MDSFFGIGLPELFMIAIVALIVLGPERLPATLREVAKFIKNVRAMINELTSQFGDEFKALEDLNPQKLLRELTDDPDKTADAVAKTLGTTSTAAKTASATAPKPAVSSAATPTSTTAAASTPAATPVPTTPKSETLAPTNVATPAGAGAVSAETPAEVKPAVDALSASDEEQRILPPAEPTEANEVEPIAVEPIASASITEGDGSATEEDSGVSKATEGAVERLADTALDTLPENSVSDEAPVETSGEDIETADIVAVDATAVDVASVEDVNAVTADATLSDMNGIDKVSGDVTALSTRPYSQGASINGAHVNGNSKENEV